MFEVEVSGLAGLAAGVAGLERAQVADVVAALAELRARLDEVEAQVLVHAEAELPPVFRTGLVW